ncbi:glycine cleavage system aminomethyltransferase GcvT [Jannaschia sp. Os4]|uniref:glycine cleavage system aminomethyltransferase GcvT n=1 Tax=Jannaschia sp. Os4 TaxID=2807617 RepID=UPI001939BBEF|nr:glycine cleavage system aminomethyltransferase GcvT [Jannaschia sp. Os4]MBM2576904.1 glycine cleavage system aminomethyltransferase GcvT [Jannaschia sp. Os4]
MTLKQLPLAPLHAELGARMTPFAGHEMPLQYAGVMAEHLHTRAKASLFDVTHMGQVTVRGDGVAEALEALIPANLIGLAPGRQRYGVLTTDDGGVLDDLMAANRGDHWLLVVNGANRDADMAHLRAHLPDHEVVLHDDRALLALQGPAAEGALASLVPAVAEMRFMDVADHEWDGVPLVVARAGYTGEDGYEIGLPAPQADRFARALLAHADVEPAGLAARDSLRLEAGLPLHGQDMSADISPVEAGQGWSIPKSRREGRPAFPGAARLLRELAEGSPRQRVGLRPEGRAPMRAGTPLWDAEAGGRQVGLVTSGGFGPTLQGPMALGLIEGPAPDRLWGEVRGKRLPAAVVETPFVPPRYKR